MLLGLAGFAALLVLLFLGVPIAFALVLVGVAGFAWVQGLEPALAMAGQLAFSTVLSEELCVIPLFVLMGAFLQCARISDDLYAAAQALVGHRRGGLAMATVLAGAGLASVSGSSLATAATMARVALPPMRRLGYADSLAGASVVAGATLAIMIPPSVPLILYGFITRTDVGALFIAGLVPGLLGALLYLGAIAVSVRRSAATAPALPRAPAAARLRALGRVWSVLALFGFIVGGLYLGWFTPTEAAGAGAAWALLAALLRGGLKGDALKRALVDSAGTAALVLVLLAGALMFANFLDVAGLPRALAQALAGHAWPAPAVLLAILAVYLVLGCVLDSMSLLFLTVPLFHPIVTGLGYDPVWFGVLVVTLIEVSLITPPVGLNVFVLHAVQKDLPVATVFRGVGPFVAADGVRVALLVAMPGLALALPGWMGAGGAP